MFDDLIVLNTYFNGKRRNDSRIIAK